MIHFTLLAKDWPGGQEEQGHGLILRDDKNNYYDSLKSVPGEGHKQPTTFRSGSSQGTDSKMESFYLTNLN